MAEEWREGNPMNPTRWATMATPPPGTGAGPDLREYLTECSRVEEDCRARLAACAFPLDKARRFDVEAIQEVVDGYNYSLAGYVLRHPDDGDLWAFMLDLMERAHSIAAELCRRRDEREGL